MKDSGSGPPRKSHTKSRKGCRTCKNRHIRCSEEFPQCKNCSKHSVRCDYMNLRTAGDEPLKGVDHTALLTTPEMQRMLDDWRLSGKSPIAELQMHDLQYWIRYSTLDLRLMYHITTTYTDIYRRGYSVCTVWAAKMPSLTTAALTSGHTMSALLGLSASQLSWQTRDIATATLASYHSNEALRGLHEAITAFTEQNSEAVLATSMLLLWQATDWENWASLQRGISTVINAMRPWMHRSELASFLENQRQSVRSNVPNTPSTPSCPPQQPSVEDIGRMQQLHTALQTLRIRLTNHPELLEYIDELLEYMQQVQQEYPYAASEQAFAKLMYLRSMIFWLPTKLLKPYESDLGSLALITHFFALGLVLEPLFPEIAGAYIGNMSLLPIEKIHELLIIRKSNMPLDQSVDITLSLIDTPYRIAVAYSAARRPQITPFTNQYQAPFVSHTVPTQLTSPYQTPILPSLPSQGHAYGSIPQSPTHSSQEDSMVGSFANIMFSPRGASNHSLNTTSSHSMMHSSITPIAVQQPGSAMTPNTNHDYFSHDDFAPRSYNTVPEFVHRTEARVTPLPPEALSRTPYQYNVVPPPSEFQMYQFDPAISHFKTREERMRDFTSETALDAYCRTWCISLGSSSHSTCRATDHELTVFKSQAAFARQQIEGLLR